MKHIRNLALLMIAVLVISSCSLFNVDVDTTFSGDMDINVEESMAKAAADGIHFIETVTIDPKNEDVEPYLDKIDEVGVNNVTAEVTYVSEENVTILKGGIVTITAPGKDDALYELQEEWDIVLNAKFPLYDQDGFYGEISAILQQLQPITIEMDAYSSVSGVTIGLKFNIDATVSGSIF
jgi:hypothetical protein